MATNLSEYYTGKGQALPSIAERQGVAAQAGIQGYSGSAEQNTQLLNFLQGQGATAGISANPIPSDVLKNQTPLAISNPPVPFDSASALVSGVSQTGNDLQSYITQITPPKTDTQTKYDTLTERINTLLPELAGKAQAQATEEQNRGLEPLRAQLADITSQIGTKTAEYNVLQAQNQNKPITMNSIIGSERAILNAKAADLGLLQAQSLGLQGRIDSAVESATRAVDLKYQTIQDEIAIKQAQLDLIKPVLDAEQKRAADALSLKLQDQKDALAVKIANEKDKSATLLNQMQSYPDAGITLSDTLESANAKIVAKSRIYAEKVRPPVSASTVSVSAGDNPQLYFGLSSPTATAVRSQVSAFKTEPIVQNFAVIQEGRNFASSIDNKTKNPADDQALIYSLAKALDPGSVVREGEYATAQKYAQSWIQAYGKGIEQAILGTGFLSEAARTNIKKTIEQKYNSSKKSYDNLYNQYSNGINNLTGRNDGTKFLKDYTVSGVSEEIAPVSDDEAYRIFLEATGGQNSVSVPTSTQATKNAQISSPINRNGSVSGIGSNMGFFESIRSLF